MRKDYLGSNPILIIPPVMSWLFYGAISDNPLCFAQAKHIPQDIFNAEMSLFDELAKKVSYPFSRIGTYRNMSQDEDINLTRKISTGIPRPIKFVITSDNRIWADNTHAALACVLKHGIGVKIREVPHYFIDLRFSLPIAGSLPSAFCASGIRTAVNNAMWIESRLQSDWRPAKISFSVEQLLTMGRYCVNLRTGFKSKNARSSLQAAQPGHQAEWRSALANRSGIA